MMIPTLRQQPHISTSPHWLLRLACVVSSVNIACLPGFTTNNHCFTKHENTSCAKAGTNKQHQWQQRVPWCKRGFLVHYQLLDGLIRWNWHESMVFTPKHFEVPQGKDLKIQSAKRFVGGHLHQRYTTYDSQPKGWVWKMIFCIWILNRSEVRDWNLGAIPCYTHLFATAESQERCAGLQPRFLVAPPRDGGIPIVRVAIFLLMTLYVIICNNHHGTS